MREDPPIDIILQLQKEGARIKAYGPAAIENAKKFLKNVRFYQKPYEVAKGSDTLVTVTEGDEFKQLDLKKIKQLLNIPVIIDGRNIYKPDKVKELGFIYKGVGR